MVIDCYGWLLNDINCYGWLLNDINGYGRLLNVFNGCGWLLNNIGYGWLMVVERCQLLLSITLRQRSGGVSI